VQVTRKNTSTGKIDQVILDQNALETARVFEGAYRDKDLNPRYRSGMGSGNYYNGAIVHPDSASVERKPASN